MHINFAIFEILFTALPRYKCDRRAYQSPFYVANRCTIHGLFFIFISVLFFFFFLTNWFNFVNLWVLSDSRASNFCATLNTTGALIYEYRVPSTSFGRSAHNLYLTIVYLLLLLVTIYEYYTLYGLRIYTYWYVYTYVHAYIHIKRIYVSSSSMLIIEIWKTLSFIRIWKYIYCYI